MTLNDRINDDLKAAMKSGDQIRLNTVRLIRAHLIELSKRGTGKELTVDDEMSALLTAAKKRKEAIEMYEKAGRSDLVNQEQKELEIINSYLPKQMSREEVEAVVSRIVLESGAASVKDLGKVMPAAMKELKGRVDGKVVQEIVLKKLGG
ncbi:MAG TPA: GatB/YqeY domain-containing protein [Bacteroidota bacterium]|nr:GatB/YqeY domain-containing protein [Bacteroidota bacterium]